MPTPLETRARRPLLNEKQVADYLGVTIKTTQKWRQQKKGPPYIRVNACMVRYDPDALDTWLANGADEPDRRHKHLRLIVAVRQPSEDRTCPTNSPHGRLPNTSA